jgi:hypothetical protein
MVIDNEDYMDVDVQAPDLQYLREPSFLSADSQITIDLNDSTIPITTFTATEKHRIFKILYVPDPTRACTPSQAEGDLAFLKTAISEHEFNLLRHLEGSIHFVSRRQTGPENSRLVVYMQEWVCF